MTRLNELVSTILRRLADAHRKIERVGKGDGRCHGQPLPSRFGKATSVNATITSTESTTAQNFDAAERCVPPIRYPAQPPHTAEKMSGRRRTDQPSESDDEPSRRLPPLSSESFK